MKHLGSILVSLALIATCATMLIIVVIQPSWAQPKAQRDWARDFEKLYKAAEQIHRERNHAIEVANQRQKFIDDTFVHFGRFFTNANVSEMEWAPGRIGTLVDTNIFFYQDWETIITPSNVVVKKVNRIDWKAKTPPLKRD